MFVYNYREMPRKLRIPFMMMRMAVLMSYKPINISEAQRFVVSERFNSTTIQPQCIVFSTRC